MIRTILSVLRAKIGPEMCGVHFTKCVVDSDVNGENQRSRCVVLALKILAEIDLSQQNHFKDWCDRELAHVFDFIFILKYLGSLYFINHSIIP